MTPTPTPSTGWTPQDCAALATECDLIYDALTNLTDTPTGQVIPDNSFVPADLNRIVAVRENRGVTLRSLIAWAEITRHLGHAPPVTEFLEIADAAQVIADHRGHNHPDLDPMATLIKVHSMPMTIGDIVSCGWLLNHAIHPSDT